MCVDLRLQSLFARAEWSHASSHALTGLTLRPDSAIGFTGTTRFPRYLDITSLVYTVPDAVLPTATVALPTAITATRVGGTRSASMSTGGAPHAPDVPNLSEAAGSASSSAAAAVGTMSSRDQTAAIVGGVLGGLLAIVLVAIVLLLRRRRRQQPQPHYLTDRRAAIDDGDSAVSVQAPAAHVAAYDTPPLSPVVGAASLSRRPGHHHRSSTGDWSIHPALAAAGFGHAPSDQASSVVARGSHFSRSSDMVERMDGPSVLGHGRPASERSEAVGDRQRDSKVGLDDLEAAESSARVTNPDADAVAPPAYH